MAGGGASCCRGAGAAPVKPPPLRPPVCDRYLAVTWPLTVDRWLRQPSPSPPQPSQVFKKSRSPATTRETSICPLRTCFFLSPPSTLVSCACALFSNAELGEFSESDECGCGNQRGCGGAAAQVLQGGAVISARLSIDVCLSAGLGPRESARVYRFVSCLSPAFRS